MELKLGFQRVVLIFACKAVVSMTPRTYTETSNFDTGTLHEVTCFEYLLAGLFKLLKYFKMLSLQM